MVKASEPLLTPSQLLKIHATMETMELKRMHVELVKMIEFHNYCRRHRISIPKDGKKLEKRWRQTTPLLSQMTKERSRSSTTKDSTVTGCLRLTTAQKTTTIK